MNPNIHKTLTLTHQHQLIDVNGTYERFVADYVIRADDDEYFRLAVVDQKLLDSGNTINYHTLKGVYSNRIVIKDSIPGNNIYLSIKSLTETPVSVKVQLNVQPIQKEPVTAVKQNPEEVGSKFQQETIISYKWVKYLWFFIGFLIILSILYYVFVYETKATVDNGITNNEIKVEDIQTSGNIATNDSINDISQSIDSSTTNTYTDDITADIDGSSADGSSSSADITADGSSSSADITADGSSSSADITADGSSSSSTDITADGSSSSSADITADGSSSSADITADGSSSSTDITADGSSSADSSPLDNLLNDLKLD